MTTKINKRKDFSQVAFDIVQQATGEAGPMPEPTARQLNSAKGGLKGGKARMELLTDAQKKELAKKAADARWGNTAPATKTSAVKPRSAKQR